jgi:hypothetical protein
VLNISVPQQVVQQQKRNGMGEGLGTLTLALLLLPFSRRIRKRARKLERIGLTVLLLVSITTFACLTGCGINTGFFGNAPKSYTVIITGSSGALTRSANVTLTVQ